ncbi:MAG: hypothetical protein GY954_09635 [Alteromonas sp.]|nr:hypothetical protein [Alteromonas sp.]
MKHEVLAICTAYEQGYGHGYDQRGLPNPYGKKTDEWEAWDYGYSEGNRTLLDHNAKVCEHEEAGWCKCPTVAINPNICDHALTSEKGIGCEKAL